MTSDDEVSIFESVANATLIAAAPDLLEACRAARQWLLADFSTLSNAEHELLNVPAYKALCAAIAKATGGAR